jgi:prepilin-type N-terminal cleavage/methylation domain-containing protein
MQSQARRGLTLIELLIAMLVFAVGALGLAASSASLAREVAWNADRFRAAALARSRIEAVSASRCESGDGIDRSATVTDNWVATVNGARVTIDQTLSRTDSRATHIDVIHAGAPCS